MAISRADFWFFIIELVTRNTNLGIPALEDGLYANVLIFDYLHVSLYMCLLFSISSAVYQSSKPRGVLALYPRLNDETSFDCASRTLENKALRNGLILERIQRAALDGIQ